MDSVGHLKYSFNKYLIVVFLFYIFYQMVPRKICARVLDYMCNFYK